MKLSTSFTYCTAVLFKSVLMLSGIGNTSTSVSLSWELVFPDYMDITHMEITYTTEANFKPFDTGIVNITELGNGSSPVSTVVGRLQPLTLYNFSVVAVYTVGASLPMTVQAWTLPRSEW